MTDMTSSAGETPLVDLLRNIPKDAVYQWESGRFCWHSSPIGILAHRAAEVIAAQPSGAPEGDMTFGFGRFVVDTGCYQQKPAVFICPVEQPGEIGASARHLGHDRHKLLPGERVLTFPTVDQAQAVADALVNATPAQPDTAALREALEECQRVFADYAEMHRHKLTHMLTEHQRKDIHRKINRNRDMSDMCLAALSSNAA